jgi:hypothetical protein
MWQCFLPTPGDCGALTPQEKKKQTNGELKEFLGYLERCTED